VVLAGGVARSARLAQLRADVLGRAVRVWSSPDVSLMGAVLLAAAGAGSSDLKQLSATMLGGSCQFEPDQRARVRYDELFGEWRELA
jgi:sugar (pentulose or hexulose) kinase